MISALCENIVQFAEAYCVLKTSFLYGPKWKIAEVVVAGGLKVLSSDAGIKNNISTTSH